MIISRPGVAGLLIVLALPVAGCADAPDDDRAAAPADAAVPSYRPDDAVPGFCSTLAGSGHLTDIPSAVGTLAGRPGDGGSTARLSGAVDDLDAVLQAVRTSGEHPRLEARLDDLRSGLVSVRDGAPAAPARQQISAALDDVGRLVQPVCGFPA